MVPRRTHPFSLRDHLPSKVLVEATLVLVDPDKLGQHPRLEASGRGLHHDGTGETGEHREGQRHAGGAAVLDVAVRDLRWAGSTKDDG